MQQRAINHMNSDHHDILVNLCKHFGGFESPQNVELVAIDEGGMDIKCDEGLVRVAFLSPANQNGEGYRHAIMEVLKSLNLLIYFQLIKKMAILLEKLVKEKIQKRLLVFIMKKVFLLKRLNYILRHF